VSDQKNLLWATLLTNEDIIHGDVKPKNVLIFENDSGGYVAKVADFGYSTRFVDKDEAIQMPGSRYWVAPEWHHRNYRTNVMGAMKMDAYSFGMLCLWLLFYNTAGDVKHRFYDDLNLETPRPILASQHVKTAVSLGDQRRSNLHQLFERTLSNDPINRTADFTQLLDLLAPHR
jgi:serine/threonine protein kinase